MVQVLVLRRVDDVDAAGQHRRRAALERGTMRRRVDAAGKARRHDEAFQPELGGARAGEFLADGRAVARADHRHDRARGKIEPALDVEQRRRGIDLGERRRIAVLADRDEARAEPLGALQLGFGLGLTTEMNVVDAAAAARQHGQRRRTG